jgi:hypothetical protein
VFSVKRERSNYDMKRKMSKISVVLGMSGVLAVGLASSAYAATASTAQAAAAHTPAWHTVLSVPNGTTSNQFDTVVATGKTSGWAFRNDGTAYERTGATTWKKVAFPGKGGAVRSAAASSPSNVWAAYDTASATQLYHWNGRAWALAKSFPSGSVGAISALSPGDVWAFGGGVFHFNGRTWTEVSRTLSGGSGSALSDSNVWALNGTDVEHYNGRTWTATNVAGLLPAQLSGHGPSSLADVIALAPNNVYATGNGDQTPRGGPGVVLHYNGRSWTRVAEGGFITGGQLASDGAGGLWIEGQNFPARLPELFHYSAGQVTGVAPGNSAQSVSASVSQIPGTSEALAAGYQLGTGDGNSVVLQYS